MHCLSLCIPGTHFLLYAVDDVKEPSYNVHFCVFHQASWHPSYMHFFIIVTYYFPRVVPPLVLHSHWPTVCWDDQCDLHGFSFNHFLTLYTIFWYAALPLCHHLTPLSVGSEFHCRKHFSAPKSKDTTDSFVAPGFQCCFHCPSTPSEQHLTHSLTHSLTLASCITCYPYYKCCFLPKNKMVLWQKHYRLENVTYWPCLACQL